MALVKHVHTTGDTVEAGEVSFTNVLYVDPSGGGYTTIQAALDACTGGEVIIPVPGTYGEALTPGCSNVTVKGMGSEGDVIISQTDADIVDFSDKTGIRFENVHLLLTAVSSTANAVTGTTGTILLKHCQAELVCTDDIGASYLLKVAGAGTITFNRGKLTYSHTGDAGAVIKAPISATGGGTVNLRRCHADVTGSGTATATTLATDSGDSFVTVLRCVINVTDDTSMVAGFGYLGGDAGAKAEFAYNDIHVTATAGGGGNDGYGIFELADSGTIRSMYNHIHVESTAGTAYSFAQAASTMISQMDDIVATGGYTGTVTMVSSEADGKLTVSGGLEAASLAAGAMVAVPALTEGGNRLQASGHFGQNVGGAAVLPTLATNKSVLFQAVVGAGEYIYLCVGDPGVDSDDWAARLQNNGSVRLAISNLNELYVYTSAAAGAEIHYGY